MCQPLVLRICLLLFAVPCSSWAAQELSWLDARTTELTGSDDEELGALAKLIGDARIVFLGEAGHGDGSSFEAKVRACRYLHEELGFSVLCFESGLYECERAWQRILDGGDPLLAAQTGVFPIWSKSEQVRPLWEYLAEQAHSDVPLQLTGFDLQATGSEPMEGFLVGLQAAVAGLGEEGPEPLVMELVLRPFQLLTNREQARFVQITEEERAEFFEQCQWLAEQLKAGDPSTALMGQCLASYSEFLHLLWGMMAPGKPKPGVMNLRDAQMARNLIWLATERYPERKFIVWGATSHLSRNRQIIEMEVDVNMLPMGHAVNAAMPGQVCSIGFVAGSGVSQTSNAGSSPNTIPKAPEGSLEQQLHARGYAQALVDLRPRDGGEDRVPAFVARPMGHQSWKADWAQVLDAIWYLETMERSLPLVD